MKRRISVIFIGFLLMSAAQPSSSLVRIGPMPRINHHSPFLDKSLEALRLRIEQDAQECIGNAKGMSTSGEYDATPKKTIETSRAVVMEVSATVLCDGVHSISYRYAIALDKTSGKRIDLNSIYNVGIRQDDHVFLRPELSDAVMASYRKANASNPTCLSASAWKDGLSSYPITISPLVNGGIALYYSAPDVDAACFPVLEIGRREATPYRDISRAHEYGLP